MLCGCRDRPGGCDHAARRADWRRGDCLFFFGSYDGFRYRTGTAPTLTTIPTLKERAGDFSELPVAIYDPRSLTNTNGITARQPSAGNVIPAARFRARRNF